jgi:hypothetical protein
VQNIEDDLEAQIEENTNFVWELLAASIKSLKEDILASSEVDKETRANLAKDHLENMIFSLAQSQFKGHANEKEIIIQLELHLKGDGLNRFLANSQEHMASIENETEVGKEVRSFIQKIIEKENNAKSIFDLMGFMFGNLAVKEEENF